ncbi:TPA: holin [Escherichia coli]|nr:holin [Escherichia coli]HAW3887089.1 holin [Escherichia coli]
MKSMDKLTTGVAYGTSAGNAGFWALQLLDKVTPSQWAAIGVLGSLVFGLLTYLTNLYFKIKEDRRKAARGEWGNRRIRKKSYAKLTVFS